MTKATQTPLREIRTLTENLEAARKALQPFAEFYPSLQQWRHSSVWGPSQEKWPEHRPVLQRTHPIDMETERICSLYVSDFKRAADLVATTDNKEQ